MYAYVHVHRLIISDLENAFTQLADCYEQALAPADEQSATFNTTEVQAAIVFNLAILSQVSNACKAVLGVSMMDGL